MPALSKWLPKCLRPAARTPVRAALALQHLEAREVPASLFTWTGNNGNNWNDGGNWAGNVAPTAAVTDAQLTFPAGAFSIDNVPGLTVDRITLNGGNTILLGAGVSLGLDGSFMGDQIAASGAANSIAGGNGLTLLGTAAQVSVAAGTQLDFNTDLTGAGQLWKQGTGTLKLTGAGSYTGQTRVFDGVLALSNSSGITPIGSGLLTVGDNDAVAAEVRLLAGSQLPTTTLIDIKTDGTLNLNGFNDVIGDVTLSGGTLDAGTGNLAIANVHATLDSLIKAGAGGHVNLLTGEHVIDVDAGKVLTITAPLRDAGGSVGAITKIGQGELHYANPNNMAGNTNSYTGLTWVKDGTLSLQDAATNGAFQGDLKIGDGVGTPGTATVRLDFGQEIPDAATVTVLNDGTFDLNTRDDTVAALSLLGGAAVSTTTGKLTLTGNIDVTGPAILPATITGNLVLAAGTHTVTVANNLAQSDLIINGLVTGAGGLTKTGPGTLSLQGAVTNDYAGITTVTGGVLELAHTAGFDAVPHNLLVVSSAATPGSAVVRTTANAQIGDTADVLVAGGGRLDLQGHSEFIDGLILGSAAGGGEVVTGVGTLTLGDNVSTLTAPTPSTISGNLSLGNAARTFTTAGDLQVYAVVSAGGIVKAGTGRLLLTGNNTYTGDTFVNAGALVIGGSQPGSDVFVNGGVFNPTGVVGKVTATAGAVAPGEVEPGTGATKNFILGPASLDLTLYGPGLADQLQVTGAVNLTGGSLALHRTFGPNFGAAPVVGEAFTIIANDGTDAVVGTFAGLPEGATVTADGTTYRISYVGGSGNDVVLTALSVPVVPPPSAQPQPYAVGAGQAGGNTVRIYNPDGTPKVDVPAFEGNVSGGVRTAVADVNGDGVADLIVGTGPGTVAEVRVFDGATGQRIRTALPLADFQGGVFVASGDFNADGFSDIVVTPDEGGGPRVTILSGKDGAVLSNFFAIDDTNFRGGARAAVGDVNGDGTPDLVVSAGFGGGPRIAVYNGASLGGTPTKLMGDFFAFEQGLRNGAYAAVGDLNGDGKADLIFGGGPGGGPRVLALDTAKLMQGSSVQDATVANFFAGNVANRGGVRVAAKNLDGDAKMDLIVGDGTGAGSHVTAYLGKDMTGGTPPSQASFDAFPGFLGGVFVG